MYTPRMKRTQIYIDEELDERLRAAAAEDGSSAAALIREAVREYLARRRGTPAGDPILDLAGAYISARPEASSEHDRLLYGRGSRSG